MYMFYYKVSRKDETRCNVHCKSALNKDYAHEIVQTYFFYLLYILKLCMVLVSFESY